MYTNFLLRVCYGRSGLIYVLESSLAHHLPFLHESFRLGRCKWIASVFLLWAFIHDFLASQGFYSITYFLSATPIVTQKRIALVRGARVRSFNYSRRTFLPKDRVPRRRGTLLASEPPTEGQIDDGPRALAGAWLSRLRALYVIVDYAKTL